MNIFILFACILLPFSAIAENFKLTVSGEYSIDMKHKSRLSRIKKSSLLHDKYRVKLSHPELMPVVKDYLDSGDIAISEVIENGDNFSKVASELGLEFNEQVSSKFKLWKRNVAPIEVSIKNAVDNAMATLENTMKRHPMELGEKIEVFLFDDLRIGMGRTPLDGESVLSTIGTISDTTWSWGKVANMKVLEMIALPWVKLFFPERKVAMNGPANIKITGRSYNKL